jgi:hypothetical protein
MGVHAHGRLYQDDQPKEPKRKLVAAIGVVNALGKKLAEHEGFLSAVDFGPVSMSYGGEKRYVPCLFSAPLRESTVITFVTDLRTLTNGACP